MKISTIILLGVMTLLLSTACAPKRMYHFGNYSNTLYSSYKNLNDESQLKHMQELELIISKAEEFGTPVPPGIYAELGYFKLKSNQSPEAIKLFTMEEQLYPESKIFMSRLIQKAEAKSSKNNGGNLSENSQNRETKEI